MENKMLDYEKTAEVRLACLNMAWDFHKSPESSLPTKTRGNVAEIMKMAEKFYEMITKTTL